VRVIEAFDRFLQRTASSFKLLIVGKRYKNYKEPESKVRSLGLDESIKFLGYVNESELLNYYQKACALLFLSMYEGFGLPILEAMSCGTPVITSNISAMPEIAGNAALLVNPYDVNEIVTAMERVIQRDIRLDLVSKGFRNIKRFNWQQTAEKTLEIYEKCKIK